MKKLLTLLLAIFIAVGLSSTAFAQEEMEAEEAYDSWFIGFNLYGGMFELSYGVIDSWIWPSFGFELDAGAALIDGLLIGGRIAEFILPTATTAIQPVLYYFPIAGFHIRAGVGLSIVPGYDKEGEETGYVGASVLGGLGYAFWIGDSFNLILGVDYNFAYIPPLDFHYLYFNLGFYWF
jgi:hypothetical protein